MTKYNQLFKQQVVNFYFEHHENLAFTLKHFNLAAKPLDIELHNTNIPALMGWRYYATKDFTPLHSIFHSILFSIASSGTINSKYLLLSSPIQTW